VPDGFLVVDKPAGITSHDVVARVRRFFGMKRVGHTGTLDPFATGVLPVALGEGTKAIPFLDESVKEYQAVMVLGAATDTLDVTGSVIATGDWGHLSESMISEMFRRFTGSISQVPPMYSAVKQGGVPLYRLARKGETVERKERQVTVHAIDIDRIAFPEIALTVRCSRGTYVRSLVDDIGRELGCGAYLKELRRTASGLFDLSMAVPFDLLGSGGTGSGVEARILPSVEALGHLQRMHLTIQGCDRVRHGISPRCDEVSPADRCPVPGEKLLLLCNGRISAVAEAVPDAEGSTPIVRLVRVFSQECPLHSGG
jgi:tRNA pseudouridine55 synthase